jgi:hypothetical protein
MNIPNGSRMVARHPQCHVAGAAERGLLRDQDRNAGAISAVATSSGLSGARGLSLQRWGSSFRQDRLGPAGTMGRGGMSGKNRGMPAAAISVTESGMIFRPVLIADSPSASDRYRGTVKSPAWVRN